jgi:putative glutamine amidotransferase
MRIGLTYTGTDEKHINYVNWLKQNDNIEVIKLSVDATDTDYIKNLDGIILSGGIDIHPKKYGNEKEDYRNAPLKFKEERDEFEISIFKLSQENNIPLLAVCRGMQLVNIILGGNLQQDLGINLNKIHWRIKATNAKEPDKAHGIDISPKTILDEIAKSSRGVANSAHHQSIKKVGRGLQVNCKSDDGIIEGLEWKDKTNKPFLLCIQWHPERMYKFHLENTSLSKGIRDRFIEEITKSKEKKQ